MKKCFLLLFCLLAVGVIAYAHEPARKSKSSKLLVKNTKTILSLNLQDTLYTHQYKYDTQNRVVEAKYYDKYNEGVAIHKLSWAPNVVYLDKYFLQKGNYPYPERKDSLYHIGQEEYTLNEKGLITQAKTYDLKGNIEYFSYSYNTKNQLIASYKNADQLYEEYFWEKDNLHEIKGYYQSGAVYSQFYSYYHMANKNTNHEVFSGNKALYMSGAFGKVSKNLIRSFAKYRFSKEGETSFLVQYDYKYHLINKRIQDVQTFTTDAWTHFTPKEKIVFDYYPTL